MSSHASERLSPRNILVLATIACAQLLVILDTTIVNVAVPLAARELDLSDDTRQWIITAYALSFGAVLLIGGRIADYWGRKRTFLLGVTLFAVASVWGGASGSGVELLAARALQGASAALMAPAALSILTLTFAGGRARTIAFGLIGGIMSSGAAVGTILGGVLTEFAGWRWCLYVNVPFAAVAAIAGFLVLEESRADGKARYDVAGAVTVAAGLAAVVFGVTQAEQGLFAGGALPIILAGVVLLAVFVLIERRSSSPLLPLRVLTDRTRGGALITQFLSGAAIIGVTLYATVYLQQVLAFGPFLAGIASLPLALAIGATTPVWIGLISRVGIKAVLVSGALIAAVGVGLLAGLAGTHAYAAAILPGLIVMGAGMAGVFSTAQNLALIGVADSDAGAASAVSNTMNQIGGAVGLAVLTNVFVAVGGGAGTGGYAGVYIVAAVGLALAALVAAALIRVDPADVPAERVPVSAH